MKRKFLLLTSARTVSIVFRRIAASLSAARTFGNCVEYRRVGNHTLLPVLVEVNVSTVRRIARFALERCVYGYREDLFTAHITRAYGVENY